MLKVGFFFIYIHRKISEVRKKYTIQKFFHQTEAKSQFYNIVSLNRK